MSASVRQISVQSEPGRPFFLRLDWGDDLGAGFVVTLCDGVSAWSGEVSEEDVSREACELEMQRDKYVQDLHLALVGALQEGDFTFQLSSRSDEGHVLHLAYEKVLKDFSFRLGSVELQPIPEPVEVIKDLIKHGLERNCELQVRNQQLEEENHRIKKELEHITSNLERYVQGKELLERELYTRFVLVLNEKKAKIRSQQQELKELRENLEEKQLRSEATSTAQSPSPAEDTYGGSTDEEQGRSSNWPPAPECPTDVRPPAERRPHHSSVEDSLSDIIDVAPCRKRRQRHRQHVQRPRTETRTGSHNTHCTKRIEGAHGKEARGDAAEGGSAGPSTVTADPEVDDLFDDF